MAEGNKPSGKHKAGAITATIWENKSKLPNGKGEATYFTVNLERNYMDKDKKWAKTTSLRTNDLPKAILVLQKSYEELVLKEQQED